MTYVEAQYIGPWRRLNNLLLTELEVYAGSAERNDLRVGVTRCVPWTGDQLTAHIAETFRRFSAMLVQSRAGDLTPPFATDGLAEENHRAVEAFAGDPVVELRASVEEFCGLADDPAEVMAHQFGPIPVGLQATFGLSELTLHHDDLLVGVGRSYRPSDEVVAAIVQGWVSALGRTEILEADDAWTGLLVTSGR